MSFLSLSSSHSPPLRWSLPLSYYTTTTATVTATAPAASHCSKNRTSERGHLRPPVVVVIVALDLWLQRWEDAGYRGDFRVVCYPHHHPADRSILCLGGGVPLLIIVSYTFLSLPPYPALSFARSLSCRRHRGLALHRHGGGMDESLRTSRSQLTLLLISMPWPDSTGLLAKNT